MYAENGEKNISVIIFFISVAANERKKTANVILSRLQQQQQPHISE